MSEDEDRLAGEENAAAEISPSQAKLFDLRRIIGGLFVVYGIVLAIVGLANGSAAVAKAQGVRINLWAGVAMLAFGLLFLAWQWIRPAHPPTDPRRETGNDDADNNHDQPGQGDSDSDSG